MIILVNDFNSIKELVRICSTFESDIDISSMDGHYIVDAKSLMGVLSLNLSKPQRLDINTTDSEEMVRFIAAMQPFEFIEK